jgi:hypothetical protein
MNVIVTGRDSYRRRVVSVQVNWLINELGLSRSRLTLEVIPKPGLRKSHGANGLSGRRDDVLGLVIDTQLPIPQLFASVAHEMIHVKQMARGTLQYTMRGNTEVAIWRGKRMKDLPYYDRPWEIEAYSKQELLARRFNEALSEMVND